MTEIIFVGSTYCPLTDNMIPIVKNFKKEHPEIQITRINTEDHHYFKHQTGEDLEVTQTPVFFCVKDGQIISKHVGKICKDRLLRLSYGDTIIQRTEDFKIL